MKRTKISDRKLPDYTRGEEIFNMVSHIVGGAFGVVALVTCVIMAAIKGNAGRVVGAAIYGASMITLYTMSSIYHGLKKEKPKKVMQVLDHCTIFFLIAGTYTPITLGPLCDANIAVGWVIFGIVWGFAALGVTFTAIDVNKYSKFAMVCYLGMGWRRCIYYRRRSIRIGQKEKVYAFYFSSVCCCRQHTSILRHYFLCAENALTKGYFKRKKDSISVLWDTVLFCC